MNVEELVGPWLAGGAIPTSCKRISFNFSKVGVPSIACLTSLSTCHLEGSGQLTLVCSKRDVCCGRYGKSMFKRFQKAGYPVQMLKTQYRMHPEVILFHCFFKSFPYFLRQCLSLISDLVMYACVATKCLLTLFTLLPLQGFLETFMKHFLKLFLKGFLKLLKHFSKL